MKLSPYLLSSSLLGASFGGHAQSSDLPATPHFYGGLGVYSSSHHKLGSWDAGQSRIPVQGVIGYQLQPRLAVQLGVAYSSNSTNYAYTTSYSSYYPPPPSTNVDVIGNYRERSTTTTLLARYGLTRTPSHRFQADLLGGAKFEYVHFTDRGSRTTHDQASPVTSTYEIPSHDTQFALSVGIGLRYRLAPRLEATYDFTFDQPLNSSFYNGKRLQASMGLGLRYHFGPS